MRGLDGGRIGNDADPSADDEGVYDNAEEMMDRAGLMVAVGSAENPGGYWPKPKSLLRGLRCNR